VNPQDEAIDTIPQDGATRKPIRVVSLFCGIGASDLGLYAAARDLGIDVEVVDAIDSWPAAVAVYNANLPHPVARVADVKTMTRADLPPHDLVIGGPPCQPFSLAGKRQGHDDPRNCLPDFLRLAGDAPWLMENVMPRLVNAGWSEKLNAFAFGDVTTRKRWFYSNYLLHVWPTPGPRRFGDIRDHEADHKAIGRRSAGGVYAETDVLGGLTAHAWHGHDVRGAAKLVAMLSKLGPSVRCPSILEMARAHSIPDSFDWAGATKTARGKMIANSWPVGMAEAVCRAMLVAMSA
jgi:site-specific DNA-cytosine methylase